MTPFAVHDHKDLVRLMESDDTIATRLPPKVADLRKRNPRESQTDKNKVEHTEQVRLPTLGIVLANVAHMRRLIRQGEISHHLLYVHFLRDRFGASLRGKGSG